MNRQYLLYLMLMPPEYRRKRNYLPAAFINTHTLPVLCGKVVINRAVIPAHTIKHINLWRIFTARLDLNLGLIDSIAFWRRTIFPAVTCRHPVPEARAVRRAYFQVLINREYQKRISLLVAIVAFYGLFAIPCKDFALGRMRPTIGLLAAINDFFNYGFNLGERN